MSMSVDDRENEPVAVVVIKENIKAEMDKGSNLNAGITETERKRRYLICANKKLRAGIKHFSERQEILEEMIELEFKSEAFFRFRKNKMLSMHVLGYNVKNLGVASTKNERYKKVLKLMRLTNEFWKNQRANFPKPRYEDMVRRYEAARPQELKDLQLVVSYDNGVLQRNPVKKCRKCLDTIHGTKSCPYKKAVNRTPDVVAKIKERIEEWKKVEGYDPLIPKGYKRKTFKMKRAELKQIHGLNDGLEENEGEDDEGEGSDDSA